MYLLKLSDLRYLSHSGNATVKLDQNFNYQIGEIRRDGIYTIRVGYVGGRRTEMKMRETFVKAFPHILTVKQGRVLIAERRHNELQATSTFERKIRDEKQRMKKALPKVKTEKKKEN